MTLRNMMTLGSLSRLRAAVLISAASVVSGCVMPPDGVDEAAVARFDNAVKSMGCVLVTEPHFLATELQTGLTRDQVVGMIQFKVALKEAEPLPEGGHRFLTEGCA